MNITGAKISAILASGIIIVASAWRVSYSEISMCMNPFFFCLYPAYMVSGSEKCVMQPDGTWTIFQAGITRELQLYDKNSSVYGLRLNLPGGCNASVTGIDLGVINSSNNMYGIGLSLLYGNVTENAWGIQAGLLGNLAGDMCGIEIGGIHNIVNTGKGIQISGLAGFSNIFKGFQVSTMLNYSAEMSGVQVSLFNIADDCSGLQAGIILSSCDYNMNGLQLTLLHSGADVLSGIQVSAFNSASDVHGVQIGLFNSAQRVSGVQIGIINYTRRLSGVQIGIANFVFEGTFPFMPVFNAGMKF